MNNKHSLSDFHTTITFLLLKNNVINSIAIEFILWFPIKKVNPYCIIYWTKNGIKEGLLKGWYSNNQIYEEINYKNGKRDGLLKQWYDNGNIWIESNYKNGKRDGLHKRWYENGQIVEEINYKNNFLEGIFKLWYSAGQVMEDLYFKNGKFNVK